MGNLISGIHKELIRNREILKLYKEIPVGAFGAAMIKKDIQAGESALESGDIIEMVRALKRLQDTK